MNRFSILKFVKYFLNILNYAHNLRLRLLRLLTLTHKKRI
jgi:hypothetical protein